MPKYNTQQAQEKQEKPAALDFDRETWAAAVAQAGGIEAMVEQLKMEIPDPAERVRVYSRLSMGQIMKLPQDEEKLVINTMARQLADENPGIADSITQSKQILQEIGKQVKKAAKKVKAPTIEWETLARMANKLAVARFKGIEKALADSMFADPSMADSIALWEQLQPYIATEFDSNPDYYDDPSTPPAALMAAAARRARADGLTIPTLRAEIDAEGGAIRITARPADLIQYPLDKPNSNIWDSCISAREDGQLSFEFDTTSDRDRKKGKEAIILFSISFEELANVQITKNLTAFDKRVYIAAAALYNADNEVFTASQIYREMGNRRQPSARDIEKINDSLGKMGAARVTIDTTGEVKVNKGYPALKYDAPLLPFERVTAYINNKPTDAAIRLYKEPPLITFARERGQINTIQRQLLESPVSKTEANLRLDDYLIERISHMKNNKNLARKILFTTLYDRCGIVNRQQRGRLPEKITLLLDHYKTCGFIKGYEMKKEGIEITA